MKGRFNFTPLLALLALAMLVYVIYARHMEAQALAVVHTIVATASNLASEAPINFVLYAAEAILVWLAFDMLRAPAPIGVKMKAKEVIAAVLVGFWIFVHQGWIHA